MRERHRQLLGQRQVNSVPMFNGAARYTWLFDDKDDADKQIVVVVGYSGQYTWWTVYRERKSTLEDGRRSWSASQDGKIDSGESFKPRRAAALLSAAVKKLVARKGV